MTIVAGIDEAGFGPILGPLLVAATAWSVPDEQVEVSLWKLLAGAVSKKASKRKGLLAIADSKKLYGGQRNDDLGLLERGVLAVLAAAGHQHATLGAFLRHVCPAAAGEVAGYPWYAHADPPLPAVVTALDVALTGNSLAVAMNRASVRLEAVRAECLFENEFNRVVTATNNKSVSLFDVTCRLLMFLWRSFPGRDLRIFVDRQGGRMHYLPALERVFEGCRFGILDESDTLSAYRIQDGQRTAEIHFAVQAEDRCLPVALASMVCKYTRELFMGLLNRFWEAHVPGLPHTGGYYADGWRFLKDIEPAAAKLSLDVRTLYRWR